MTLQSPKYSLLTVYRWAHTTQDTILKLCPVRFQSKRTQLTFFLTLTEYYFFYTFEVQNFRFLK